jgi:hypothetical protein
MKTMASESFAGHRCDLTLRECKTIEVVHFCDGSYGDRKLMTGWGVDGILYTFEVVTRKPIPMVTRLSDASYHGKDSDDKLPEP